MVRPLNSLVPTYDISNVMITPPAHSCYCRGRYRCRCCYCCRSCRCCCCCSAALLLHYCFFCCSCCYCYCSYCFCFCGWYHSIFSNSGCTKRQRLLRETPSSTRTSARDGRNAKANSKRAACQTKDPIMGRHALTNCTCTRRPRRRAQHRKAATIPIHDDIMGDCTSFTASHAL